ncbi:MAG: sulfotransferase [Anaerolineales bacterium]|nr:sulfotransferase [Anaerolineales bacterium]NUQ58471.1 sulfotransferase [Anaerolineales bacterium]
MFPREFCLITGSPRSGTSALVRWLGKQKQISAFPESRILVSSHRFLEEARRFQNLEKEIGRIESLARKLAFDYYIDSRLSLGKRLIVDKEPLEPIAFPLRDYEKFIINVRKIIPRAKILFAIRDPLATIWSMSRRTWGESLTEPQRRRFTLDEYIEDWNMCAELVLENCAAPNVYIVQFGRLINDPANESKRIFDFLGIRGGALFEPRETNEINFDNKEREKILTAVAGQVEKLRIKGIKDLS